MKEGEPAEEATPVETHESVAEPSIPAAGEAEAEAPEKEPTDGEAAAPTAPATAKSAEEEGAAIKKTRPARPRSGELATLPDEQTAQKKWYVIHAHSGHENKVRQSLDARVKQEHLEDLVSQIIVPSEEVAEVKGGKKRISSRKIFPGYVLIEMKLTHRTWQLIRTTAGVTGFIGSGKMPTALEPEEIESIFQQMRGEKKKPKPKVSFEKEEKVKIIEGPFTNFMGYVDEVNPERGKLKVMVEIFERLTSVELEFWQVEKV
ncbi:MAG: transcription termination/antitermination factor NusG [Candidatus Lindowbacteria bacterium]|nr:transcription termination/antitermination factor NusG [Candidatus Lindowbacteria bacterium]